MMRKLRSVVWLFVMLAVIFSPMALGAPSAAVTTLPITITPTSGLPYTAVAISGGGFTANTDGSVTVASITFGGV
ncbi:MAG: hypothetical protein V3R87_02170, partial [Dehalococcoidia bacterium]